MSKKGKAPPPPKKDSMSGHKTFTSRESDFLREQFIKETKKREDFAIKIPTWKKPRNPTIGELTSREDAEYLMPINTSFENDIEFKKELNDFSSDRDEPRVEFASFFSDVAKIDALKRRKQEIEKNLEWTKKVLEHKKMCMAAGAGAMSFHSNFDSTREYIDNNNFSFREKKETPIITHIEKQYKY